MSDVTTEQHFLALFADVFSGRHDCYAEAYKHPHKPGKLSYAKKLEPLTNIVLSDHLKGVRRIGVYPLVDNYVRWFAVDFDAPKGTADTLSEEEKFILAWGEADKQAQVFEEAGLFVYLERSRAKGVHLWGFFDEPVEAETVLKGLKPLLLDAESYDRMYPVQKEVKEGGFGNLIALPFHGESLTQAKTAFLNRETLEVIEPLEFMRSITFNNRYVIEELAEKAPKDVTRVIELDRENARFDGDYEGNFSGRPAKPIRGFLKMISEFGCKFMNHAVKDAKTISQEEWWVALGQLTCFKEGRSAAHLMSQLDTERYSPEVTDETFDRLLQHPPHGCAYIHAKFPKFACNDCPMKAPYHCATKPILSLVGETATALTRPNWKNAIERIRDRNSGKTKIGIKWGLPVLDDYTRLRRADLIVIGARPSIGKTAFMVDRAVAISLEKTPVFIFSGETGEIGLTDRLLSRLTGIDSKRLRGESPIALAAEDYERLDEARQLLERMPLYINFSATRADQILELIEETILAERIPLDQEYVIFQDYLQFGNPGDGGASEEYGRLTKVTAEFKFVAKILQRAFVTFSQLKRDTEGDEKPDLDTFKGTGRIEEAADVAMVLSGDRVSGSVAQRWLHNLKQREGEVGWSIRMLIHQAVSRFETIALQEQEQKKDLFEDEPSGTEEL